MTDELIRLARQFVLPVGTHYDGCEADHPVCLLLRMADQFEELLHDRQRLAECERDAEQREVDLQARLAEAERLLGEVHDCEDADHALDASLLVSIDEFLHPTAATDSAAPKKHTTECSYWDGLMAQVCNCGLAERDHNDD